MNHEIHGRTGLITPGRQSAQRVDGRGMVRWALGWLLVAVLLTRVPASQADEVKVWEYSPYEVQIWFQFEPSVMVSAAARQQFLRQLEEELARDFKSAWNCRLAPTPPQMVRQVARQFDALSLEQWHDNELVLVVSSGHPETRVLRTPLAVLQRPGEVLGSPSVRQELEAAVERGSDSPESLVPQLLSKLKVEEAGEEEIVRQLTEQTAMAALLPRRLATGLEAVRPVGAFLPWQLDTMLGERDKLFWLIVDAEGDRYRLKVRELDCPMHHLGPVLEASTTGWSQLARTAAHLVGRAFAPVGRVESADANTAVVRHRAGGLILDDDPLNPARIHVGDVMQPIIRRDDRNGVPTLLQALNFTYAAITQSDGVHLQASVYTYSGGPGLRGRQNPRTHRMLLRVRPQAELSDLQIVVRGAPERAQATCFVYARDLLTNEFSFLGRTDWRGRLTVNPPAQPPTIRLAAGAKQQSAVTSPPSPPVQGDPPAEAIVEGTGEPQADGNGNASAADQPPDSDVELILLRAPLMQLYVKSGDNLLARLPFVPGHHELAIAELPDDSLRLQSEALVRGFQGEILDLVGQRNLLAARARQLIEQDRLEQASDMVERLKSLKDFNQINDELSRIQRGILEQIDASVPRSVQAQIDRMFKTTRDMLQKFLQDQIVSDTADLLRRAHQRPDQQPTPEDLGDEVQPVEDSAAAGQDAPD